jgi:O-antigen/teichoic acid export membrane protein
VYAGGLLFGKMVGSGVTCTFLGRAIWRQDAPLLRNSIRVKEIFSLAGRYWKFPVFNIWGSFLNALSWQAPIWLLASFFSPAIVGFYAVGNRLIRAPMTLVGHSIAQVFFREASESEHEGRLGNTVDSVFRRLVSFGLLPAILIFFVGEELFAVLLGEPWREAGVYTQILAPFVFFWFISSPLSQLINVKERQGTGVLLQAAILVFRVVPLIIGGLLGDARFAIILFSISGAAVYGFLSWWLVGIAGGSRRSAFRVIMKYGFQFAPAVVILTAAELWTGIGQWSLLGLAVVLGSVYLVWLVYEDRALLRSLQPLIQRIHRFHW